MMTTTVQQFAYEDTYLQKHYCAEYCAKSEQKLPEVSRQSQTETDRYLSLKQNFGKRVALLEAIKALEAYEDALSDLNCFDNEQLATRKDVLCVMDNLLELVGNTLVFEGI